ncbi:MAG: sulfurtransferase TusA family protein [Nocardioides sp.]|nr:sulfurtransferase TusA family protein [Nocardioides sp.]
MSSENDAEQDPGQAPALELDCRGQRCPLPIIRLANAIGDVAVGEVLAVMATDVAARADVPAWCRMRGHDYLGEAIAGDGVPAYRVRRRH